MTNEEFMIEVEKAFLRSKRVLMRKQVEYSDGKDRLGQFYRAASTQDITPTEALMGMATKHITSIADMCKDPLAYSMRQWREKIVDLRNYTFLLEAMLSDLGVE